MIAIRLSKCGYGKPSEILDWDTNDVIFALEYEQFMGEYENAFTYLNRETK